MFYSREQTKGKQIVIGEIILRRPESEEDKI
jgi:hypothetical protein